MKAIRNDKNNLVVASDLNGTLTTGSPVLAVYRWLEANQPDACPPLFKYRILFSYLQVKAGLKKIDTWGKEAMSSVLALIQDPDPDLLQIVMEFVVEEELWPKRRNEPIALLREFLAEGASLFVISAAYQPAVAYFARIVSPEHAFGIGTGVAITDQGLALSGPFNSRERKLTSLLEVIGSRDLDLALGDTFADIPLLEKAQRSVAVHPDRKLRRAAEKNGWQILD